MIYRPVRKRNCFERVEQGTSQCYEKASDTIAAIGTPLGTGGISIIRMSGTSAIRIGEKMLRLRRGQKLSCLKSWSMALADVVDPETGELVDEAVVLLMKAPRSYTAEDVVEIQCHGGRLLAQKVLSIALKLGARPALPGEFTKRAFLNGRISLDEAEAVLDLVTSSSELALAQAGRRLKGELGALVEKWERCLVEVLGMLHGAADFPENVEIDREEVGQLMVRVEEEIKSLLDRAPLGLALNQGVEACLVGRPNVGKSSLFNALLTQQRAIVTDVPGTTRDVLRERTEWYGIPVILLDTAGLRETSEIVEAMGVERAKSAAFESEAILYVVDDTESLCGEDRRWIEKWRGRRLLVVVNKVDLERKMVSEAELKELVGDRWVKVSSKTGEGVEDLKRKVVGFFAVEESMEKLVPGSARQVDCLRRAESALSRAISEMGEGWTEDVVVLSLEEATRALMELTGKRVSQEVLDEIFRKFCVGK